MRITRFLARFDQHLGIKVMCVVLMSAASALQAQAVRDPTVPPAAAGLGGAGAATGERAGALVLDSGSMAVLVRDGVYYLVLGTRLYRKGQTIDQTRIERITETEVWLRENGIVRKVAVFDGIERRAAQSVDTPRSKASGSAPRTVRAKP